MIVFPLVFAVAGFAAKVDSFPSSDLAFPGEINVENSPTGEDRFRQDRYPSPMSQQWTDSFRPPNSRPGDNYIPTGSRPGQSSRPSLSRPGGDYRPQGSRPNGNFGLGGPQRPGQGSQPSFSRPEQNFRPQATRPIGNFYPQGSAPEGSRPVENSRPQSQIPNANSGSEGSLQPDFLAIDTSGNSGFSNQNSGFNGISTSRPGGNGAQDFSTQATETSTLATTSTTKIPRRDPGYRIIFTSSCPCSFTRQYKPVCGDDGQTYGNEAVLQCAVTCGKAVKVFLEGSCGRNNGHAGAIDLHYR